MSGPESRPRVRARWRAASEGHSNREIAESLFVTIKTVEFHLRGAYRKLSAASRGELRAKLEAD